MKKVVSIVLSLVIMFYSFSAVFAETPDSDVPSDWAADEVSEACAAGFVPEELQHDYTSPITRGEFSKLAVLFAAYVLGYTPEEFPQVVSGCYSVKDPFSDTDDEFAALAAQMAVVYGVGGGRFEPDRNITREEAAVMLERLYSTYRGGFMFGEADFSDNDLISEWARNGVRFCASRGIMTGVSEDIFDPKELYTREQAIATFVRLGSFDDLSEDGNYGRLLPKALPIEEKIRIMLVREMMIPSEMFETPYGIVVYSHTAGVLHTGYDLRLFDEYASSHTLLGLPYRSLMTGREPPLDDLTLSEDKKTITFNISFSSVGYSQDGNDIIHNAGTYYFETNIETMECTLLKFVADRYY